MASKSARSKKPRYQPHPMLGMEEKARAKLKADTGKSWEQWVQVGKAKKFAKHGDLKRWYQEEHGIPSMNAYWIASGAFEQDMPDYEDPETLVNALYAGAKETLRPTHEAVVDVANALGDDVIVTSCKTMVPIYRKHVFAELKPVEGGVTAGLAIGEDVPARGRLQKADGRMPGDRLTHRVLLKSPRDVDGEFKGWLAKAYEHGLGKMARAQKADTPPDVAKALKANAKATATWGTCTDAMRRDFIQWITSAKQEETRTRRVAATIEKLAAGKKRMY